LEAGLEDVGEVPGFGGGVEDPLLDAGVGLGGGVGVEGGIAGEAIALFAYIESGVIGEPEAEGSRRVCEVPGECCGEARENAHVVEQAVLRIDTAEIERCDRKRCASCGNANTLRAGGARGVDEIDGIDAVAATAFGEVDDIVEDGQAAEVVVLADLIGLVAEEGDGEAAKRSGCTGSLEALRCGGGVDELRSGAEDDAVGLRVCAVACVASRVEEVGSVGVVEDRGAAVVAAVGVGFGEGELAVAVDGGDGAEEVDADGVGGIDDAGCVGVGGVNGVNGSDVTHEREQLAIGGEVQRYLGLGAEAGDELIAAGMDVSLQTVRNFEAVEEEAEGRDLIEEDLRGNAKATVDGVVVEDEGVGAVIDRRGAGTDGFGAVGRKLRAYGDVVRIVVVDAAGDDEIAGEEVDMGSAVGIFGVGGDVGCECGERQDRESRCEQVAAGEILETNRLHGDS